MEEAYEEFGFEGVFDDDDAEMPSSVGGDGLADVPVSPRLTLFSRAFERITALYHHFDLEEAGIDVAALLQVRDEEDVVELIEGLCVELSVTANEAARLVSKSSMRDVFALTADYRVRGDLDLHRRELLPNGGLVDTSAAIAPADVLYPEQSPSAYRAAAVVGCSGGCPIPFVECENGIAG